LASEKQKGYNSIILEPYDSETIDALWSKVIDKLNEIKQNELFKESKGYMDKASGQSIVLDLPNYYLNKL
jgi:hypothetical protein